MYKYTLVLTVFLFALASCKKDDTKPATPASNTPYTPPADGSPSQASQFYGIFRMGEYTTATSTSTYVNIMGSAYFSNQPVSSMYSASSVKVAKVYLNSDSLTYSSTYKYYNLYSIANLASETWSVNGANGISSFTFANAGAVTPTCTGLNNVQDSISISTGFTVNVNNVSNFTTGSIILFDGTGNANGYYATVLSAGNNAIVVSPANLASLTPGNANAKFAIVLSNDKAFIFGGKDFKFSREAQYTKDIKIKP